MPVERRRIIAIIVTLLLAAGGIGAYVSTENRVNERVEDGAATAVDATAPGTAAAVRPTVAPAPEAPAGTPGETAEAQPPAVEPPEAESVVADPIDPEPIVPEPIVPSPEVAGAAEPAPAAEVVVAAAEPAAPAEPVVAQPLVAQPTPETPAPAPAAGAVQNAEADAAVFDLVRVEPTGDAVIAGRTRAGATVELLRNGERHDVIVADATGAFAFVPPPLPPGTHEIALRIQEADGTARRGRQSVTVVVAETMDSAPVVALAEPGAPTRVLSQPEAPPPAAEALAAAEVVAPAADVVPEDVVSEDVASEAEPAVQVAGADAGAPLPPARAGVRIASVEAESGGGLYVSGEAAPEAAVRLYLNETFVGGAAADDAGAVSFAIGTGVRPGLYRVRLDEVGGGDGRVLSRAEVTFEMPALPSAAAVAAAQDAEAAEPEPLVATTPVAAQEPVAEVEAVEAEPAEPAPRIAAVPPAPSAAATREIAAVTTTTPPISAEATGEARTATLTIPAVNTALVVRGDSLWRISRRIYGDGIRYTVIFDANQDQIRNPDLIFPGQVFVLPAQAPAPAAADAGGG
ncbi:LysM peptidoglycan-binding domain-containing protein [Salinarimonas chemoclinalis]|uniref:LysM peptidoglycan-binding domain-containing protein n=1 Tax=Salinarimonas chemoclinalis TaxID=3241599 RepID=UPI003556124E